MARGQPSPGSQDGRDGRDGQDGSGRRSAGQEYLRFFNLAMSFGIAGFLALYIGYQGGRWLDEKLGTTPFLMFLGILTGAGAAFKLLYDELLTKREKGKP